MSEHDFSRSLSGKLKKLGYDVTKLESHDTEVGIPDLFVQGFGSDLFIELKVIDKVWKPTESYKIPWRPGQQPWAHRYLRAHANNKCTLTVVKFTNEIIVIPMIKLFGSSIVPPEYMSPLYKAPGFYCNREYKWDGTTYLDAIIKAAGDTEDYDAEVLWYEFMPKELRKYYSIEDVYNSIVYEVIRDKVTEYFEDN